jgi:hypothetical protein
MALIVGGRVRCLGTPSHLNRRYGFGYNVDLRLDADAPTRESVRKWLDQRLPGRFRFNRVAIAPVNRYLPCLCYQSSLFIHSLLFLPSFLLSFSFLSPFFLSFFALTGVRLVGQSGDRVVFRVVPPGYTPLNQVGVITLVSVNHYVPMLSITQ